MSQENMTILPFFDRKFKVNFEMTFALKVCMVGDFVTNYIHLIFNS